MKIVEKMLLHTWKAGDEANDEVLGSGISNGRV